jgi:hypothetical protein
VKQCVAGDPMVCPADAPLFDARVPTCEASLFFQSIGTHNLCRRSLLLGYDTPTLQKQGPIWLYHFPVRHQVSIRCPHGDGWTTLTETLSGAGIIHNASACAVDSSQVRTLPELRRTGYARLDTPGLYLPDLSPILASHEMPQIDAPAPVDTAATDDVRAHLLTPQRTIDVDTLLQIRRTSPQQESAFSWPILVSISSGSLTLLLIATLLAHVVSRRMSKCSAPNSTAESNPVPSTTSPRASCLDLGTGAADSSTQIAFTSYSLTS